MTDKDILKTIADNPLLLEALTRLLEGRFQPNFKDYDDVTNEDLGAYTRARLEGIRLVKDALAEIQSLRSSKAQHSVQNPAR